MRKLLAIAALIAVSFGVTPIPADASPVKGKVDVCVTDAPRSWTKGLSKKANRTFDQKIKVHRVTENELGTWCDVLVWVSNERDTGQAVNVITGDLAGRYFVLVGSDYNYNTVEVNVGSGTPKKARTNTIVSALKKAGIQ